MIGIGAGAGTDGQVLVLHDLLGVYPGRAPRFAKQYADLRSQMLTAVGEYAGDVRERRFPARRAHLLDRPGRVAGVRRGLRVGTLSAAARRARRSRRARPPGDRDVTDRPAAPY